MVTSMLNPVYVLSVEETLPQNVNYALKAACLRPLLQTLRLPQTAAEEGRERMVERLGRAVFQIRAKP